MAKSSIEKPLRYHRGITGGTVAKNGTVDLSSYLSKAEVLIISAFRYGQCCVFTVPVIRITSDDMTGGMTQWGADTSRKVTIKISSTGTLTVVDTTLSGDPYIRVDYIGYD